MIRWGAEMDNMESDENDVCATPTIPQADSAKTNLSPSSQSQPAAASAQKRWGSSKAATIAKASSDIVGRSTWANNFRNARHTNNDTRRQCICCLPPEVMDEAAQKVWQLGIPGIAKNQADEFVEIYVRTLLPEQKKDADHDKDRYQKKYRLGEEHVNAMQDRVCHLIHGLTVDGSAELAGQEIFSLGPSGLI